MIWLYRTPNMFFFSSEFLDLDSARVVLHNTKFKIILFSYRALELSAHSWSYVPEMTILGTSSLTSIMRSSQNCLKMSIWTTCLYTHTYIYIFIHLYWIHYLKLWSCFRPVCTIAIWENTRKVFFNAWTSKGTTKLNALKLNYMVPILPGINKV